MRKVTEQEKQAALEIWREIKHELETNARKMLVEDIKRAYFKMHNNLPFRWRKNCILCNLYREGRRNCGSCPLGTCDDKSDHFKVVNFMYYRFACATHNYWEAKDDVEVS